MTCVSNTTPRLPKKTSCCRPISASLSNGGPQEALVAAQELREKFQQTKKALQEELEAKIATVRSRA